MIKFTASLKQSGKCIKIDSELETEVLLSVPASDISEIIKMLWLTGKSFEVQIKENGDD